MHNYFFIFHTINEVINVAKDKVQNQKTPGKSDNKQSKSQKKQNKPDDI